MKNKGVILLVAAGALLMALYACFKGKSASVGIIGGADGPTAIFLAGKTGAGALIIGAICAALLAVIVVRLIKKK